METVKDDTILAVSICDSQPLIILHMAFCILSFTPPPPTVSPTTLSVAVLCACRKQVEKLKLCAYERLQSSSCR